MPESDLNELKRRLRTEGYEVYRTVGGFVSLAERIRDNLILDSGVAVGFIVAADEASAPALRPERLSIRVTLRAQASHYPGAHAEAVAQQAQQLAEPFLRRGYVEDVRRVIGLPDPGAPERTLDTSYETVVCREVTELPALFEELRLAFLDPRSTSDE